MRTTKPNLLPFYSVDGQPAERCDELPLRGYRDSRPVRYGNAASSQLQIGSWGDLLETASLRQAVDQMARTGYGIVPVVSAELRIVGLVSRTDVLGAEAKRLDEGEELRGRG